MWPLNFLVGISSILGILIILFGKFNDGGWYTLAALWIQSGAHPFVDFHYPHTPHYVYLLAQVLHFCPESIHPTLFLRFFSMSIWIITLLITLRLINKENHKLVTILILCQPYQIYFLCIVKCYGVLQLLILLVIWMQNSNFKWFSGSLIGLILSVRISAIATLTLMPSPGKIGHWLLFILAMCSLIPAINSGLLEHWFLPIQHFTAEINSFNQHYLDSYQEPLRMQFNRKLAYLLKSCIMWSPFLLLAYVSKNLKVLSLICLNIIFHLLVSRPLDEYSCFLLLPCSLLLCQNLISAPKSFYILSLLVFFIQIPRFSNRLVVKHSQIVQLQSLNIKGSVFGLDAYVQSNFFDSCDVRQILGHLSIFNNWSDEFVTQKKVFNHNTLKVHLRTSNYDWLLLTNSQIKEIKLHRILRNYRLIKTIPNMLEGNETLFVYQAFNPQAQ